MTPPAARLVWTPGPTGAPIPPTVEDLLPRVRHPGLGPAGLSFEEGVPAEDQMPVLNVVYRVSHKPVGILSMKLLDGTPEIVNIAVLEGWRRLGIGRALCECALEHGIDLRDIGYIWGNSLTPEGQALRDGLAADRTKYGYASWEKDNNAA